MNKSEIVEKLNNPPKKRVITVEGHGFTDAALITHLPLDKQITVLKWMSDNMRPAEKGERKEKCTSYRIKHILEYETGIYLTNNQFKDASEILGYQVIGRKSDIDWHYNISRMQVQCTICKAKYHLSEQKTVKIIGFDGTQIIVCRKCEKRVELYGYDYRKEKKK